VPQIVSVARFHPVKRHEDLIEALALLDEEQVAFRCIFVGSGQALENARSLAEQVGLKESTEFSGELAPDQVAALLKQADIFVLCSDWEGLPRSVMEAMAAGLPVVGTDVNGINELVIHRETGLLVPPRDPEALAHAIRTLLLDPELRIEMGRKGRSRVKDEFDLQKTTQQLEDFYASAIAPRAESG
jgi:glycosyltransferase involved in cell wall biosynthesis